MSSVTAKLCAFACVFVFALPDALIGQTRPTRIAVLWFGASPAANVATASLRSMFVTSDTDATKQFTLIDTDLATAAAHGSGFDGRTNLSLQQARDIGAAIGCDFYFIGDSQTLRRTSTAKPLYYESYASIFLVSARTGRLILWRRPSAESESADESVKQFMLELSSARNDFLKALGKAEADERAERQTAIGQTEPIIEILSDEDSANNDISAPRPYRRLKPPYPDAAARAEVEATVDALVDIDAKGEVVHVEIARWAGYGLDESVISTIRQMHFFPALREGMPIQLRVLLRYNFRKPPPNSSP